MAKNEIYEVLVSITSPQGLHARPAALLAKMASGFQSMLTLERVVPLPAEDAALIDCDEAADCRSIMSLLMLAATCGTQLQLRAEGQDAREAAAQIAGFFESGFGETD